MSEILDRWPVGCDNSEEYVLRREGSEAPHYVKHWSDGMWGVEGPSLSCVAERHAELLSEIARLRTELESARLYGKWLAEVVFSFEEISPTLQEAITFFMAPAVRAACEGKR